MIYYVDVMADTGKPDSVEAGQAVSDITKMYSNHESVTYVRNKCLAKGVTSFKTICPDVARNVSVVSMHRRQLDMMESHQN